MGKRTKKQIAELKQRIVEILSKYTKKVTFRQLYYRMVALGYIPNSLGEYKNLNRIVVQMREKGELSANLFTDLERIFEESLTQSRTVRKEINLVLDVIDDDFVYKSLGFQPCYVEVWVEKKALHSIFEPICNEWSTNLVVGKGYSSVTFLYEASQRFEAIGIPIVILYFGDFDPTGLDIFRHLQEKIQFWCQKKLDISFKRPALTETQIKKYNLIPAPAKITDSRTKKFLEKYENAVYELDALDPPDLDRILGDSIKAEYDEDLIDLNELYSEKMDQYYRKRLIERIKDRFNLK